MCPGSTLPSQSRSHERRLQPQLQNPPRYFELELSPILEDVGTFTTPVVDDVAASPASHEFMQPTLSSIEFIPSLSFSCSSFVDLFAKVSLDCDITRVLPGSRHSPSCNLRYEFIPPLYRPRILTLTWLPIINRVSIRQLLLS